MKYIFILFPLLLSGCNSSGQTMEQRIVDSCSKRKTEFAQDYCAARKLCDFELPIAIENCDARRYARTTRSDNPRFSLLNTCPEMDPPSCKDADLLNAERKYNQYVKRKLRRAGYEHD